MANALTIDANLDTFLGDCRKVLAERGEERNGSIQGHISVPVREYRDDQIVIRSGSAGRDSGLRNTMFEVVVIYDVDGKVMENPAIMIADDDRLFREHGDWMRVAGHAAKLADPLVSAVAALIEATEAFETFERDHPNDATSRWDALLDAKSDASDAYEAVKIAYKARISQ